MLLVHSWQGLLITAELIWVMAKAPESSDPLPSCLLQRVASDNEMVKYRMDSEINVLFDSESDLVR